MPLLRGTVDKGLSFSSSYSAFCEDAPEETKLHYDVARTSLTTDQRFTHFKRVGLGVLGALAVAPRRSQFTNSLGSVMYPVSAEAAAVAGLAR